MTPRILIADADPLAVNLLSYLLESCGYLVDAAGSGALARELAKKNPPDLMILGLELIDVMGPELIRSLRRPGGPTEKTPILSMTGQPSRSTVVDAILAGATQVFAKSEIDADVLLRRVAESLGLPFHGLGAKADASQPAAPATPASPASPAAGPGAPPATPPEQSDLPNYALPDNAAVGEFLDGLLGCDTQCDRADPIPLDPKAPSAVACFNDEKGRIGAVCVMELPLAAHCGAALSMIPVGVAAEAIKAGTLSEDLKENVGEVFNVGAGMFNLPDSVHLKLDTIAYTPGDALPDSAAALLANPVKRLDVALEIPDYGGGRLTIVINAAPPAAAPDPNDRQAPPGPEAAAPAPAEPEKEADAEAEADANEGPRYHLPDEPAIRDFLVGMLGKEIVAEPGEPVPLDGGAVALAGVYVSDDGETGALIAFDLPMAAYGGAALSLIPPGASAESVKAKKLSEELLENARELMNVAAGCFNEPEAVRLKLGQSALLPDEELPDAAQALAKAPGRRLDLKLTVPDYGEGYLSILVK